ncbi:tyrosine-type recombinase/integrase [Streptomyces sp. NPDC007126]|uniref:tyrosine-type recombinase/integrase n=1 Tax=Streptomyces sp. NPDC007126 TaxID=3364774 RepID=UPI0036B044E4
MPGLGKEKSSEFAATGIRTWLNRLRTTFQYWIRRIDTQCHQPRCCTIGQCCSKLPSPLALSRTWWGEQLGVREITTFGTDAEMTDQAVSAYIAKSADASGALDRCLFCRPCQGGGATVLPRKAGLRRIRFHDLRHSTATLLLEQGVELVVIKELLGHAHIGVTATVYAHVRLHLQRTPSTPSAPPSTA